MRLIREVPLGERTGLWFWPYVAAAWTRSHFSSSYDQAGCPSYLNQYDCASQIPNFQERSRLLLEVGLQVPLMVQVASNYGVGAGPYFEYAYAVWGSGRDIKQIGLSTFLVGSF